MGFENLGLTIGYLENVKKTSTKASSGTGVEQ
jgi:hypothetical protein